MAAVRLSVCMIVRDEETMLADCLSSIRDVADQIVVVDTGSLDKTVEIAKSFGAEVHSFQWCDDFAAARNESLSYANGKWILWLDADERLESDSQAALRKIIRTAPKVPTLYRVYIRNLQADQLSITLSSSHRLISNHAVLRFQGRIHEQLHYGLEKLGGVALESNITLYHHGYALAEAQLAVKQARNRVLLETLVAEQPDSAYAHFTLGQNLALSGDYSRALSAYEIALALKDYEGASRAVVLNAAADACWQLSRVPEAEQYARESISLAANQIGGYFIIYRVLRSREDVSGQIEVLENLLERSRRLADKPGDLPQDIRLPDMHLWYSLGELYGAAGNFEKAAELLGRCVKTDPGQVQAVDLWLAALANLGYWREIADYTPDNKVETDNARHLRGTALLKLSRFDEALKHYESWLADAPKSIEVRKRLAGLYAKMGDRVKAEDILRG
ncbi:MAG: glycosyltransferase [Candidatus Marinimicrobia bacterium]|nr:glycosyltransferase [Candidatus Neomarinimicrobiota bacterium]